jgi:hypothetical protein
VRRVVEARSLAKMVLDVPAHMWSLGDPRVVALEYLIENAARYARLGSQVTIRGSVDQGREYVVVQNIPAADLSSSPMGDWKDVRELLPNAGEFSGLERARSAAMDAGVEVPTFRASADLIEFRLACASPHQRRWLARVTSVTET